ncbi:MAG: thioredoxin family protein [Candidatus Margulisiibacteriota bacterium]|jgi:thioredoxin 1
MKLFKKKGVIKMLKHFIIFTLILLVFSLPITATVQKKKIPSNKTAKTTSTVKPKKHLPKVTFIELGSVKCMPCKMMEPILREVEKEYPKVKVIFYDVWSEEGQPYGKKYQIRVIPTQIFLDSTGNEYFRHEGFFPKEDLIKIIEEKL